MTDCRHRWFLASWRQNDAALSRRFDDWVVRCGHCRGLIAGCGSSSAATEVIWSHDGSTWFGSFGIAT